MSEFVGEEDFTIDFAAPPIRADGFDWTPQRVADLRAFLRLRKTPTQISQLLHCSRASVYACMVAHGLKQRLPDTAENTDVRADKSRAAPPVIVTLATIPIPVTMPVDHVEHPIELLTAMSCRWPIGTVGREGFRFCMATKQRDDNSPYCRHHARIAYPGRR
jgi:hypothetical protein